MLPKITQQSKLCLFTKSIVDNRFGQCEFFWAVAA